MKPHSDAAWRDSRGEAVAQDVQQRCRRRGLSSPESAMQQLSDLLYQCAASLPREPKAQAA